MTGSAVPRASCIVCACAATPLGRSGGKPRPFRPPDWSNPLPPEEWGVRVGVSPAPFLSPDWFKPLLRVVGVGVGRLLVTWFQFQDGGLAGDSKFQDGDQFYQPNYYQPINFQTRNSPSDCDVIYSSEA